MQRIDQYFREIESKIDKTKGEIKVEEIGEVQEIKDEVIFLNGLNNVAYGELIELEGDIKAFVIDLKEDSVGAVVLGDYSSIKAGEKAKALGRQLSLSVCEAMLNRVINPLGIPLDGAGKIRGIINYPLEKIAPGVIYRRPVNTPIQTGIKAVDALLPIGRGQRELIIGDRGTGKTTLATDTIINQKKENIICIYCAIGQKESKVALIFDLLKKHQAMDYTIIVNASASSPASLQYLAPYSACAIAEYFMDKGRDVLVIYDDLTKHAWAYRQISLVLRRPAGREAYPGDIFYLHSRLLERACHLADEYRGGSITALPIVETQEGDISGYIPTNIISITDGQIFLETDLFNAGIRPAINVGNSVSRVGSAAQTKAMKQVAGRLKLDLAQYRELAAFAQFESELDDKTKKFLDRGARITEILKQDKNQPLNLAYQVLILWAGVNGYLDDLPLAKIKEFEKKFLEHIELKDKEIIDLIITNKILDKKTEEKLRKLIEEFIKIHYPYELSSS